MVRVAVGSSVVMVRGVAAKELAVGVQAAKGPKQVLGVHLQAVDDGNVAILPDAE